MALTTALLALAVTTPGVIYDFKVQSIEEKPVPLSKYKGKVLLVVNVASKCGLTKQYDGLEKVYAKFKKQGFEVLGFPANNFGGQEPGTNEEIKTFCTTQYKVTFPMFAKISVKDADIHPLYQWLVASSDRPEEPVEWNFGKFLVDRKGKVIARFSPRTTPEDPALLAAIESALK